MVLILAYDINLVVLDKLFAYKIDVISFQVMSDLKITPWFQVQMTRKYLLMNIKYFKWDIDSFSIIIAS
jgi:hypothetical protein